MAEKEEKKKQTVLDKESKIPVIRCDANIFKNMQAIPTSSCEIKIAAISAYVIELLVF